MGRRTRSKIQGPAADDEADERAPQGGATSGRAGARIEDGRVFRGREI